MKSAFLLPHVAAKVQNPEAKRTELLNRLKSFVGPQDSVEKPEKMAKFNEVRLLIEKTFDEKTLTLEMVVGGKFWAPFFKSMVLLDRMAWDDFEALGKDVEAILQSVGYREKIWTRYECALSGGTEWVGYSLHVPIGMLKKQLSLEEARTARDLVLLASAHGPYYCSEELVSILLEPLDDAGKTVCKPRPVDKKMLVEFLRKNVLVEEAVEASLIRNWKKGPDFPEDLEGR